MKNNIKIIVILTSILLLGMSSCKTKEVPGRRRTPRHCNTCTKWSYMPQEKKNTLEVCLNIIPTDEGENVSMPTNSSFTKP